MSDLPVGDPSSVADDRRPTWRLTGYPQLWLSTAASAISFSVTTVVIGWLALELTGSSLVVGLTFAARLFPALLLGIPIGVMVDRFDRRTILIVTNLSTAGVALALAGLFSQQADILALVLASIGLGFIDTIRGTASQSYAFDLAGAARATTAMALINLGNAIASSVGGISGGLVLDQLGAGPAFALSGVGALVGALILVAAPDRRRASVRSVPPSLRSSFTLLARHRSVRHIALIVIAGEVFGFGTLTLYPAFAAEVLATDAAGLGVLAAARSVGGFVGLILLAQRGPRGRAGLLLLATTAVLGSALVALSFTNGFVLAVLALLVVGAGMSTLDTIGQSLIQQQVADQERGAAVGIWFFAIGFGPFGHLGLGGLATVIGVSATLAFSGGVLVLVAALARVSGPIARLR